jgi:PAS domain S-box-containing protein
MNNPLLSTNQRNGKDALFEFATEGILIANDKGIILRINDSALKLFQYEKSQIIGQAIEQLIPSRFHHKHQKVRENYHQQPSPRSMGKGIELFGQKKNGQEFPVEVSLSPFSNSQGNFVIAFILDITNRKLAEEHLKNYSIDLELQVKNRTLILEEAVNELERTKMELKEALEKEKELNELKSRFVSMASHEFRTPLATILSSLSLVKKYGEQQNKEDQDRHIVKIKSAINNLTDILNDFLSVSRLEEGKIECKPEYTNVREFIEDMAAELFSLRKEGMQFQMEHFGNEIVFTDPKLLKNIFFNLISNAIKFSNENSVIKITSSISDSDFTLKIEDNGIGISEEDQAHLFERFFRAQNATHIQGTGLGLNIVGKFTELLYGKLTLNSKLMLGTTITIQFNQQALKENNNWITLDTNKSEND